MADLEIFGGPQSNFVWAVRLALLFKGTPYKPHGEWPHSDAVRAINPLGKIPAMRHGDVTLAESRAIVGYIDATFDGPKLIATDPAAAARDEMYTSMAITAADAALIRGLVFAYLFPNTPDGQPDREKAAAAMDSAKTICSVFDKGVRDGAILGKDFRLPDAWLLPMLFYASRLPEWEALTAECPALASAMERWKEDPWFAETYVPLPEAA